MVGADHNTAPSVYNPRRMPWLFSAYAFGIGAIVGSFLNVLIHRYPRGESIVLPPSHCPNCNAKIKPYDNVPVLSYLWLAGRCRACREPISARYPLVELANGLFYWALFQRTGLTPGFLILAAVVSMLLALIYIDLDWQILPDVIDLPGILLGLGIGALHLGAVYPELLLSSTFFESATGAVVGCGIILVISLTYKLIRKTEGMGLGDAKMMAMLGAIFGWEAVLFLLVLASFAGAIIGVFVASRSEEGFRVALPFGVFLGMAALVMLFFGHTLRELWLRLLLAG
jgi:leader peptidase (prepilin peptidase) / N-methyltransferase